MIDGNEFLTSYQQVFPAPSAGGNHDRSKGNGELYVIGGSNQHRLYCYHHGLIYSCILSVADADARQHKIISRQFSEDDR